MITIAEFKKYINLEGGDKDSLLETCILNAMSHLDTECNRALLKESHVYKNYKHEYYDTIYLIHYPIRSVSAVQYFDGTEYADCYDTEQLLTDNMEINIDFIKLRNVNIIGRDIKVTYVSGYTFEVGTGTLTTVQNTNTVTGVSTLFKTECTANDFIIVGSQRVQIASIESDTRLTLKKPFTEAFTAQPFNISSVPNDLSNICLELAAICYYNSGQSLDLLIKASDSVSSGSSENTTYKNYELKGIDKYKRINV